MRTFRLTTDRLPLTHGTLPEPVVVATLTADPRVLRRASPQRLLTAVAAKLGLLDFAITCDDEPTVTVTSEQQLDLFER